MKVDNAIILAAGLSSRFGGNHKGFIEVNGETLIERQIRQLREAGINEIIIVVGHQKERFESLKDVILVENPDYKTDNNLSSIRAARNYIHNSYICSSDNYFVDNPFSSEESESYYSVTRAYGPTKEWCVYGNPINKVIIGGENWLVMMGHSFWDETFTKKFLELMDKEYNKNWLWEDLYIRHLDELKMRPKLYEGVYEFDTQKELEECNI